MKYSILKKLKNYRPTIALTTLLLMLACVSGVKAQETLTVLAGKIRNIIIKKHVIMKKRFTLICSRAAIALLLVILAPTTSVWADGNWTSDKCSVKLSGGKLTVKPLGDTGAMLNYTSSSDRPWDSETANITSIVIGNGVESIGAYA